MSDTERNVQKSIDVGNALYNEIIQLISKHAIGWTDDVDSVIVTDVAVTSVYNHHYLILKENIGKDFALMLAKRNNDHLVNHLTGEIPTTNVVDESTAINEAPSLPGPEEIKES